MAKIYRETFDDGPGGWLRLIDNFQGTGPLIVRDSSAVSFGPWWVDYNHAPPGAGYLSLLMLLNTKGPFGDKEKEFGGENRFVANGFPHDFTNADVTLRCRGELELRGAQVLLLIQGTVEGICSGWALTGQPVNVSKEWNETRLCLVPDKSQWTALGARHDRTETYGEKPLEKVLANVNVNIYLVLFPLNIVPMGDLPAGADMHKLRAGKDYPIWTSKLPDGYFMLDEIKIKFMMPSPLAGEGVSKGHVR